MYRIGLGNNSRAPYIFTPEGYVIKINKNARTSRVCHYNPRMLTDLREFTFQDIALINDFEFTNNESAKAHVRKAVEQCIQLV